MIKGLLAGLALCLSNDEVRISKWLAGTWVVVADSTESYRPHWLQVYTFEACDRNALRTSDCTGFYGWVERTDALDNLLDKSYFSWSVQSESTSAQRTLTINGVASDFVLRPGKKQLHFMEPDSQRIRKSLVQYK